MAKITAGALAAEARGKLLTTVFTRDQGGNLVRWKPTPFQPNTQAQTEIKANASSLAKRWGRTLSTAQRAAWNALAAAYPRVDVFGQAYTLTGLQMYLSLNQGLFAVGNPTIDAAPGALTVGFPGTITINWTPPAGPLTLSPTNAPGLADVPTIYATRPISPGIIAAAAKLRKIGHFAAGTAGPWNVTTMYTNKFHVLPAGNQVILGVKYTDNGTGFHSLVSTASVIL